MVLSSYDIVIFSPGQLLFELSHSPIQAAWLLLPQLPKQLCKCFALIQGIRSKILILARDGDDGYHCQNHAGGKFI